MLKHRKPQ